MNNTSLISAIVVNLNGRLLLAECLDSLINQDYLRDRVEIILVDNGSTDDSGAFVREAYPSVRVIETGKNLGFAGGNNLAAGIASGKYLAFLNNDARADLHWLSALVEAVQGQPDVACAAAKMLSEDGKKIDFVGPVMNLYGRAFQIDEGLPATPGLYDQPRELLAPCGGAMLIRRDVFLRLGGFDEDYIAYYEDVDLGWRLWLCGYRVLFVPKAVVYHKGHQAGSRFAVEQRYALSEVNALRTVIKNYDDQNLLRVLPFSLFMGVKRSLDQAGLDREQYRFGSPVTGDAQAGVTEPEPGMTRVATAYLAAIDQVAEEMPRLLDKRRRIQAMRVRSDEEIFVRFPMRPDNWLFPWRQYTVVQEQLAKDMGVPATLQPRHGSRLLIITHETIGPKMAGPGIRAWEMACALADRFEVMLAAPGEPARAHPGVRLVSYATDNPYYPSLDPYINSADVVLAMGPLFVKLPRLRDVNKPAVVDLYDPFELEKLAQSFAIGEQYHLGIDLESATHLHLECAIGDFFVCASERQRDFWLGTLLACGRVNTATYQQDPTLRKLIGVVPFGIPSEPPRKQRAVLKGVHPGIGPNDKVLLWNGGLWQWFDPLTLVDALVEVLRVRDDVRVFFAAGRHFDQATVPEMPIYTQTLARCRELGLSDRYVFFGDWIPYDERGDYLLEADLGVSIHRPGLESRFASRTRLLDCVWAGLPVISTGDDPLSDMIAERGLGRTVPPGDVRTLAQTILEQLTDEGLRERTAQQARAMQNELTWQRAVEPIATFLECVAFAPDAVEAARKATQARRIIVRLEQMEALRQQAESEKQSLMKHNRELEAHIVQIQHGRVMRFLSAINKVLGRQ